MRYPFILFFIVLSLSVFGQIKTGAEQTDKYFPLLAGKQVGICANHTSTIGTTHLVDTLLSAGIPLKKIYAPEHGFRGDAEAGAHISSSTDSKTGLPIISLYGKNKKPTPEQLQGIEILIFDMQDVGCRFYTYISTLHYIMEACAENNIEVLVLDRPNPNGYFVDGPILEEKYRSFVGMHPIPAVHGLTIAEYALMINGEYWLSDSLQCQLQYVANANYDHTQRYQLPRAPSPNLPTQEAIYLYPSLCLFEGTTISLGRGTLTPFQIYGHPELTYGDYYFTPQPIKGVSENPPQKGKKCRGENLTEYAQENLQESNSFNISFLLKAYNSYPDKANFFNANHFFDKLAGSATLRWQIINGRTEEEIRASWQKGLAEFKAKRKKYLLYPDFQ